MESSRVRRLFLEMSKGKKYPIAVRMPFLFASNWLFQGMLQMDRTEVSFRLFIDGILTLLFSVLLFTILPILYAIGLALVCAHTLNWALNGQIPVIMKNIGMSSRCPDELLKFQDYIVRRTYESYCIKRVYSIGSYSRGHLRSGSDLDIRLLRTTGFRNGLGACALAFGFRTRALLRRIPLDLLVADSLRSALAARADEIPIDLFEELNTNRLRTEN